MQTSLSLLSAAHDRPYRKIPDALELRLADRREAERGQLLRREQNRAAFVRPYKPLFRG